ncbi:peptidoglycan-binding domain-containing protein [Cupriavidus basilensis]|uniref:peptidoglycan-binding domain-containing protein n=1 Tax=Cupriavidus basilensis TaxID=68895 RepID=UPI0023E7BBDB|nr:peptidoglycan-binding domain-containing protein [Cupriavidus basilensis]MDF3886691.1 peptidoglycan-binding domain-containing protein [Cupriavidus basilensis]
MAALQRALQAQQVPREDGPGREPAIAKVDGQYGIAMQRAVQRVQRANKLLMTGVVDHATWQLLMGKQTPWPGLFERLLYVVAGFEGHFYSRSTGDRENDRVGMTWGIIGFKLCEGRGAAKGSLHTLLTDISAKHHDIFVDAFGKANADKLDAALALDDEKLYQFAAKQISTEDGDSIRSPWNEGFSKLGESEIVREMQRRFAYDNYFVKSQELTAQFSSAYAMDCERTSLYFFDFKVNNGGFIPGERPQAEQSIKTLIARDPKATVAQKLQCITDVLAASRSGYAVDIRERKGVTGYGYGNVHREYYRLDGWGIDVAEPSPAVADPLRLAVIGLDGQEDEQLALAGEAKNFSVGEEAAVQSLDESRFPIDVGYELLRAGSVRTVSLRKLAATGAGTINDKISNHYHAAQMLFRGQVGVLAISGQFTRPIIGDARDNQYVLQRNGRTYVGLQLKSNGQLMLLRQRTAGHAIQESVVDITDLRRSLSSCALIVLYGGYGVPVGTLPGSGLRWREWVGEAGANPIVLGWFGNVQAPRDGLKSILANAFLSRVRLASGGKDLPTICHDAPEQVIEQWGLACHEVFVASRQKYLWLDEPISSVSLMHSGAAAIDHSNAIWRANTEFGKPLQSAMIRA